MLDKAALAEKSEEKRDAIRKRAVGAESSFRREAILKLAKSEPGIPLKPTSVNSDGWLLNVANGTVDLRTGELRGHDRLDYITHVIAVDYQKGYACPQWINFLNDIFSVRGIPDGDLVRFIQKAVGYSLTGDVTEQVMFILCSTVVSSLKKKAG